MHTFLQGIILLLYKEMRYVLLLKIDKFRKNEQLANFAKNEFNENIIALN